MNHEISFITAFLLGLLGSVHCVGMCGGIMAALTLGLPPSIRNSATAMLAYLLAYNVGRITSYMLAGALVGVLGQQIFTLTGAAMAAQIGRWLSGLFMVALGIYLAGWTRVLAPVEKAGTQVWRYIEPLGRRFLPVRRPNQALGLGLVWGWLPCGLVYSALAWALVAGDALRGAQFMVAFGLGTLPMLLLMGAAARWLGALIRQSWIRQSVGAIIVLAGLTTLILPHTHHSHSPHVQHHHEANPRFRPLLVDAANGVNTLHIAAFY